MWGRAFRPVLASLHSSPLAIVSSKELRRLHILESKAPREAWILRTASDIEALRGIELMPLNERNAQSGQRLSTPAGRRAASMRAERHFDWHAEVALQPIEDGLHGFDRECPGSDLGLPRQPENAPAIVRMTTQYRRMCSDHLRVVCEIGERAPERLRSSTPSHHTISARVVNEPSGLRSKGTISMSVNPSEASGGSSSR